jgi:hypothetical protein
MEAATNIWPETMGTYNNSLGRGTKCVELKTLDLNLQHCKAFWKRLSTQRPAHFLHLQCILYPCNVHEGRTQVKKRAPAKCSFLIRLE